jgi:hypothetical protein
MAELIKIDLTPLEDFQYNQISNYKFEFMLANSDLQVVHTPFECKDYLQDIFWCETMKKSATLYGLKWKPGMFDITTEYFYLVLSGGSVVLNTHIEPLKKFLNTFEEKLSIEPTEIYATENEKIIVLKFNREWTTCGPMLSAYTTLIRVAGAYQGGDVMDYLFDLSEGKLLNVPEYVVVEKKRLKGDTGEGEPNIYKLAALLEGKKYKGKWEDVSSMGMAHHYGITTTQHFPTSPAQRKA